MRHELKCWRKYFDAVWTGKKKFELRRNDRKFQVGDELLLRETEDGIARYTGREVVVTVTHIFSVEDMRAWDPGASGDFVILSFESPQNTRLKRRLRSLAKELERASLPSAAGTITALLKGAEDES